MVGSTPPVRVQAQGQNAHFLRCSPRAGYEDADRDIADVLPFRLPALGDARSQRCCLQSGAFSLGKVASVLRCFVSAALSFDRSQPQRSSHSCCSTAFWSSIVSSSVT
ncbi:hypothetical protein MRX96_036006 [Rhipicephalus microplus]